MNPVAEACRTPPITPASLPRVLGRYASGRPGPTLVVMGGLHGNEPAGTFALLRVLEQLRAAAAPLRGSLLGLRGNIRALAARRRFLQRDLNRRWSGDELRELAARAPEARGAEDSEQHELLAALATLLNEAREPLVFLDLHSTSGHGAPFVAMADVLRNRPVAFALPIPLVLGLEEFVDGSLLGYLCDLGHVAVAVEGGQNEDPRTVDTHEAAIWLTLEATGALPASQVPGRERHLAHLVRAAGRLPRVIEIRHRHVVHPDDEYETLPGFENFSPVHRGQVLAHDRRGAIAAREDGVLMLPLYQQQGEDGFFLARPVSRLWLELSRLLRHARLDRLVPWLPGVAPDPGRADHWRADPRVARFLATEVFHLFGYRRVRSAGERLLFSRRRPDRRGLGPIPPELRAVTGAEPPAPRDPDF